ncbi:VOC family protein [Luteolibacter sp. AS25]|uniref:VOC family protein n=1 Tax=Luteolibacter sp. AS25 TaxID=3135776 RepID=UPI00398A802F
MEKVTGIGGFFFKSKHPNKLNEWYESNLGIQRSTPGVLGGGWWTSETPSVVCAEPEDGVFGGGSQSWYLSFTVADLDAMIAQLMKNGVSVELKHADSVFGRFAQLNDPEGNHIELWEPSNEVLSSKPDKQQAEQVGDGDAEEAV